MERNKNSQRPLLGFEIDWPAFWMALVMIVVFGLLVDHCFSG